MSDTDTLAEATVLANAFETEVVFAVTLHADALTPADVRGVLTLIEGIVDSINTQWRSENPGNFFVQPGDDFKVVAVERWLIPEVHFESGSLRIWVPLKSKYDALTEEGKTRVATLVAATILAVGGYATEISADDESDPPTITVTIDNEVVISSSQDNEHSELDDVLPEEIGAAIDDIRASCAVEPAVNAWKRAQEDLRKYGEQVPISIEYECNGQHYVFSVGERYE